MAHFDPFKGMWYAKNIIGETEYYYTQYEAEKFAGILILTVTTTQTNHMETKHTNRDHQKIVDILNTQISWNRQNNFDLTFVNTHTAPMLNANEMQEIINVINSHAQLLEALKFAERIISSKESGIPSDDLVLIRYTIQTATNDERK